MSAIRQILVLSAGSRFRRQMQRKCSQYSHALLFSSVAEVPDYSDMDALLSTKRDHEEITRHIEQFLKKEAWHCYTLSTDSCSICEKCTYPKKSCAHPDLMHPCIESHGILLTKNIEENQMDYYMGDRMVLWFSLIFLNEA